MRKKKQEKDTRKRVLWIAILLFTWMIAIVWRLAWLQVVKHEHYAARAVRNHNRQLEIAPSRGTILDRTGKELAFSLMSDSLFVDLKQLTEEEDRQKTAGVLAPLLGYKEEDLLKKLSGSASFVWLKRKLEYNKAQEVKKLIAEYKLAGVGVRKESERFYPNDTLAAHLVGYVGLDDNGLGGIEQSLDSHLRGTPGEIELVKDGKNVPFERRELPAMSGAQIHTTIDLALQHKVEVLLDQALQTTKARGASAIVVDPKTGDILALANSPTFNPNERRKTSAEQARHNRAISFPYEPGSIFKIITYSAALEDGAVKVDDKINCGNGQIVMGKHRIIRDTHSYGVLSVADAFAKSSNVGAIRVAQKIGKERFYDYILKFGFGRKTGIELPGESRGIVNPLSSWRPDSIGSVAMGQEISVTLLQAIAAVSTIANEGVWTRPHLVKQVVSPDGRNLYEAKPETRRVVSEATARKMTELMTRVVTSGTGRHAVRLSGYTAAGKTGTPQKVDEKTKAYSKTKYMPSFAGFVPAANPRFAIIVMIDEPVGAYYGGSVAAPVFNLIAEAALGDYAVPPDDKSFRDALVKLSQKYEDEQKREEQEIAQTLPKLEPEDDSAISRPAPTPIPNPTPAPVKSEARASSNISASSAAAKLAESKKKSPANAGPDALATIIMPNFKGRGIRAVMRTCNELNLNVRLLGSGIAVKQSPAPGIRVRPGEECKVEFK